MEEVEENSATEKILLRGRDEILASLSDFEFSDKGKEIFFCGLLFCKDFFLRLLQWVFSNASYLIVYEF